jgi:hypothetical protein
MLLSLRWLSKLYASPTLECINGCTINHAYYTLRICYYMVESWKSTHPRTYRSASQDDTWKIHMREILGGSRKIILKRSRKPSIMDCVNKAFRVMQLVWSVVLQVRAFRLSPSRPCDVMRLPAGLPTAWVRRIPEFNPANPGDCAGVWRIQVPVYRCCDIAGSDLRDLRGGASLCFMCTCV